MYVCYGISNGHYYFGPGNIWEIEDRYLWRAPLGCGIVVQEKDELVLDVSRFDSTKSMPVEITLTHEPTGNLIVNLLENSFQLVGKPQLVWGALR